MTTPTLMYGLKQCDTVKKAMHWLDQHHIAFEFHDLKRQGLDAATLEAWFRLQPWSEFLNRRGTTWRKLSPEQQTAVHDEASAHALMLAQPSVIRRPIVLHAQALHLGFSPEHYQRIFLP